MTFIEKLTQLKKDWDIKKDYDRDAMEEVYQYNLEFRKTNPDKYAYNSSLEEFILEREKSVPADLIDMLGTEIYLSQHQVKHKEQAEYKAKMLSEGWLVLDSTIVEQALKDNKNIKVSATASIDWMTVKIDNIYKPHMFNGQPGLMKLRSRSRGYALSQFENAFCQLV